MKTVDICYFGETVALPDVAGYAKFYRKLAAGAWEPATFAVLARNLDGDTVYVDIGAWVGVTPFWASRKAKAVIAIEPDPRCLEILGSLAPRHANVTVLAGALSAEPQVVLHAVDGFGSSESSLLDLGGTGQTTVPGLAMDAILAPAGDGPIFVKIDIEGYEFAARGEIAKLRDPRVKGVQLAVHPQLLEKAGGGGRLSRRLRTVWSVWRLARALGGFFPAPTVTKYRSLMSYIVTGVMFRARPKGADLVFERAGPSIHG